MKNRPATIAKLRSAFAKVPGAAPNVGGFLTHRMDEVLSGVRSAIAVKVSGADLAELRRIGEGVEAQMKNIRGIVDLALEPQIPIPQIQIEFDRLAASRYGLSVANVAEMIEIAFSGRIVSQVLENQQSFDLVVWLKPEARQNLESIGSLLIDTPSGTNIPLSSVAKIKIGQGPNTINHENVSRTLVVAANAKDRDLRSIVNEIEAKVKQNVTLPNGYFIAYAGQFEAEERATQNIIFFGVLAFIVITVLMYLSVKSIPSTIAIMINLPIGLIGGVLAIAMTGGILSIASLVGFVSLFGVATRNGLLLVDNYNTKHAAGMPLAEVVVTGSMERLNAIVMTALTSALGLAPTILQHGPGQELLQPLSIVVFGGLFTSTAITIVVLPAIYIKFGNYLLPKNAKI
jgi:Cu/Ag efflux pump CusA